MMLIILLLFPNYMFVHEYPNFANKLYQNSTVGMYTKIVCDDINLWLCMHFCDRNDTT